MKKLLLVVSGIIGMGLLSAGCSQSVTSPTTRMILTSTSAPPPVWATASVSNPDNPCDSVGFYHNAALDYSVANFPIDSTLPVRGWVSFEIAQGWVSASDSAAAAASMVTYLANPYAIWDTVAPPAQLLAFKDSLETAPSQASSSSGLVTRIKSLESEILTSSLPDSVKPFILREASVLRYSSVYWDSCHAKWGIPSLSWSATTGKARIPNVDKPKPTVGSIVQADGVGCIVGSFVGFVGGAVRGAIGGLFSGGPAGGVAGAAAGAVVGSAVGAVQGAVGGSIKEAIRK